MWATSQMETSLSARSAPSSNKKLGVTASENQQLLGLVLGEIKEENKAPVPWGKVSVKLPSLAT